MLKQHHQSQQQAIKKLSEADHMGIHLGYKLAVFYPQHSQPICQDCDVAANPLWHILEQNATTMTGTRARVMEIILLTRSYHLVLLLSQQQLMMMRKQMLVSSDDEPVSLTQQLANFARPAGTN